MKSREGGGASVCVRCFREKKLAGVQVTVYLPGKPPLSGTLIVFSKKLGDSPASHVRALYLQFFIPLLFFSYLTAFRGIRAANCLAKNVSDSPCRRCRVYPARGASLPPSWTRSADLTGHGRSHPLQIGLTCRNVAWASSGWGVTEEPRRFASRCRPTSTILDF